jgi:hypothetical protein
MKSLEEKLSELAERIEENNSWRQRKCFNLIPSKNTPSLFVKLCEISDPSGRYAEHKTALKADVAEFRSNFLEMKYCLTAEQTIRLGTGIFESMMPKTVPSSLFPKP